MPDELRDEKLQELREERQFEQEQRQQEAAERQQEAKEEQAELFARCDLAWDKLGELGLTQKDKEYFEVYGMLVSGQPDRAEARLATLKQELIKELSIQQGDKEMEQRFGKPEDMNTVPTTAADRGLAARSKQADAHWEAVRKRYSEFSDDPQVAREYHALRAQRGI